MKKLNNQQGFSIVEASLIILVIALLAASGWFVYNRQQNSKTVAPTPTSSSTESPVATGVATSPNISTVADLDRASAALDQTDPTASNSSDTSLLNNQLSAF